MKLAKSCSIIIACTVVYFVPFAVTYPFVPENLVINSLKDWACVLSFSASFFNSLVFFLQNPVLKNEAKKVLLTLVNVYILMCTYIICFTRYSWKISININYV